MSSAYGVVSLYKLFLNRLPESAATLEAWTQRFGATVSGAEVTEFRNAAAIERGAQGLPALTIDSLYQSLLNRSADSAGRAYWQRDFGGSIDDADLAAFIEAARVEAIASGPQNSAVDNAGSTVTLFMQQPLSAASNPLASQFTVRVGDATIAVSGLTVVNNQITLRLASAVPAGGAPVVSYNGGNATNALRSDAGTLAAFTDAPVRSALSLTPSLATSFQPFTTLALAGAEITAFDKTSSKLFVTSDQGLQIVRLGSDLRLEADAHALFQIVGNLVDNAIKFTPEGGRIAVPQALVPYMGGVTHVGG